VRRSPRRRRTKAPRRRRTRRPILWFSHPFTRPAFGETISTLAPAASECFSRFRHLDLLKPVRDEHGDPLWRSAEHIPSALTSGRHHQQQARQVKAAVEEAAPCVAWVALEGVVAARCGRATPNSREEVEGERCFRCGKRDAAVEFAPAYQGASYLGGLNDRVRFWPASRRSGGPSGALSRRRRFALGVGSAAWRSSRCAPPSVAAPPPRLPPVRQRTMPGRSKTLAPRSVRPASPAQRRRPSVPSTSPPASRRRCAS